MAIEEVLGRDVLIQELLDTRIRAALLVGPSGIGKRTVLRYVARQLAHPTEIQEVNEGLSIVDLRLLVEGLSRYPLSGHMRVVVLDCDVLRYGQFGVLLKPIEETPSHLRWLLYATSLSRMPATIPSRCEVKRVKPLDFQTMVTILKSRGVDTTAATAMALRSRGSFDRIRGPDPAVYERALSLFELIRTGQQVDALRLADTIGQEEIEALLFDLLLDPEKNGSEQLVAHRQLLQALPLSGSRIRPTLKTVLLHLLVAK